MRSHVTAGHRHVTAGHRHDDGWWHPLLGLAYQPGQLDPASGALDCRGAVLAAYRLAGSPLPCTALSLGPSGEPPEGWIAQERASQPLDVIACGDVIASGLWVLVEPGLALTSALRTRGVCIQPLSRVAEVVGIYRWSDLAMPRVFERPGRRTT